MVRDSLSNLKTIPSTQYAEISAIDSSPILGKMADKSHMAEYPLAVKKFLSFLLFTSIFTSAIPYLAQADSRDDQYSQVLYKAWENYLSYTTPTDSITLRIHSSSDIPLEAIKSFSDGVRWTLKRYGSDFSTTDVFHLIFASSYSESQKLISEVNGEILNYDAYNIRHLSIAKSYFDNPDFSTPAGGTSSRGCNYDGSPYGNFQGQIKPCPSLKGGAIYAFGTTKAFENNFSNLFTIGAHEGFHLVLTKMNPYSHYTVPEWIIEGVCQSIGLTASTTDSDQFRKSSMLNPSPSLDPSSQKNPYDLAQLETQGKPERFAIGVLATDFLLSKSNAKTFFGFLATMNNPRPWEVEFEKSFGFSKSIFYEDFKDFHSWYYSKGVSIIKSTKFPPLLNSAPTPQPSPVTPSNPTSNPEPTQLKPTNSPAVQATKSIQKKFTTITCVKGKFVKKVTGVKPVCPKGYKKK